MPLTPSLPISLRLDAFLFMCKQAIYSVLFGKRCAAPTGSDQVDKVTSKEPVGIGKQGALSVDGADDESDDDASLAPVRFGNMRARDRTRWRKVVV